MLATGFVPDRRSAFGKPSQPSTGVVGIPAPIGGINAVDTLASMDPSFCLDAVNLIADGRTMRVRPGYKQFATNVGNGNGVSTIIPFQGATTNRLYAIARNGIFNITAGGAGAWVADVALSNAAGCGRGVWTNFVSDAGTHYCWYADPVDGLYRLAEGGSFAAVTDITGVAETDLMFVTQHKGRMWFAQNNTAVAWYLAPGAISGAATSFNFGNKFNHGGTLVGLYNWSVDGGEGIDDHLVAISSSGDVMVYKGTDPSAVNTWQLVGQYYIGGIPVGRRVALPLGGDLFILSQYGVIPLTRLMRGALVQDENAQVSRNIAPLISTTMQTTRLSAGWEMRYLPNDNAIMIGTPKATGQPFLQYIMSTRTGGWTTWESLPYNSGDVYLGTFYFGDSTSTVYTLNDVTDGVTLAGAKGADIEFSLFTTFQEFGDAGQFHRPQLARVVVLAGGAPGMVIKARYDYDLSGPGAAPSATPAALALWDTALWDSAVWGAAETSMTRIFGLTGIGRAVALAVAGRADNTAQLVRIDLFLDKGGPL